MKQTMICEKPTWQLGKKWTHKTFKLGMSGIPLYGTSVAKVVDKGNILINSKWHEVFKIRLSQELNGEKLVKGKVFSEKYVVNQISYVKCSDLSMLMDISQEDVALSGNKTKFFSLIRTVLHNPPLVIFKYPLKVGKKWSTTVKPIGMLGQVASLRKSFKVVNFPKTIFNFNCVEEEKIHVPAGEYQTIRIVVDARHFDKKRRLYIGNEFYDYYSPEIGQLAKSVEYSNGKMTASHELVSHVPK